MPQWKLTPPDDELAESWLSRWDSRPRLVIPWPPPQSMAVVCVRASAAEADRNSEAWVITSESELKEVERTVAQEQSQLFFRIPKRALLESGVCPGLAESSFVEAAG